jgi:hypothetical protein
MVQVSEKNKNKLTLSSYGNKESENGYDWRNEIAVKRVLELLS